MSFWDTFGKDRERIKMLVWASMYGGHKGSVIWTAMQRSKSMAEPNPKLMKRLSRSPRSFDKKFYYFPSAMTQNPDVPQGAKVRVLEKADKAGTILVSYNKKKYLVFLTDLCDNC